MSAHLSGCELGPVSVRRGVVYGLYYKCTTVYLNVEFFAYLSHSTII